MSGPDGHTRVAYKCTFGYVTCGAAGEDWMA